MLLGILVFVDMRKNCERDELLSVVTSQHQKSQYHMPVQMAVDLIRRR